jgi:hypothetical protein
LNGSVIKNKGQLRRETSWSGIQWLKGFDEAMDIVGRAPVTEVEVAGCNWRALENAAHTTHDDEFNLMLN